MRQHYDKKSQLRLFLPGNRVLALLPIFGNPLSAKFHEPYVTSKVLQNNNHLIKTPDWRKSLQLLHVNRLKEYLDRDPEERGINNVIHVQVVKPERIENDKVPSWSSIRNADIVTDATECYQNLSIENLEELLSYFNTFSSIFSDFPKLCPHMQHDIELTPGARPMKQ